MHGVADGVDLVDVGGGVGGVFPADGVGCGRLRRAVATESGDCGGAEAEVIAAFPVAQVVAGVMTGGGIVRGLVVAEVSAGESVVGEGEEAGVEVGVVAEFSFLELLEVSGVFLVGEVVAGDMIGFQGKGLGEIVGPARFGLMGDGEHEVEVAGGDAGLAEEVEGFCRGGSGVVATEGLELVRLEGLNA